MTRSASILAAVAANHNLQVSDIIGPDKFGHMVAARHEAIRLMRERGIPIIRIAQACRCDRTTVLYHLSPTIAVRKKAYYAKRRADARRAE